MNKLRTLLLATAATVATFGVAQAQESNPVTSDPPVSAIGRQSETSPGTPNRQNSAPGVRHRYYGSTYYGYDGPAYGDYGYYGYYGSYYSDPPSVLVTPDAVVVDVY